jgi:hypothetical protein
MIIIIKEYKFSSISHIAGEIVTLAFAAVRNLLRALKLDGKRSFFLLWKTC